MLLQLNSNDIRIWSRSEQHSYRCFLEFDVIDICQQKHWSFSTKCTRRNKHWSPESHSDSTRHASACRKSLDPRVMILPSSETHFFSAPRPPYETPNLCPPSPDRLRRDTKHPQLPKERPKETEESCGKSREGANNWWERRNMGSCEAER